jgi:hypothetical protein
MNLFWEVVNLANHFGFSGGGGRLREIEFFPQFSKTRQIISKRFQKLQNGVQKEKLWASRAAAS